MKHFILRKNSTKVTTLCSKEYPVLERSSWYSNPEAHLDATYSDYNVGCIECMREKIKVYQMKANFLSERIVKLEQGDSNDKESV